jgi:hypothetical protein
MTSGAKQLKTNLVARGELPLKRGEPIPPPFQATPNTIAELPAITPVEYGGLQAAYEHFNAALFDGELPNVFITYQRHAHMRGYFGAERMAGRDGNDRRHELALNPDAFVGRSDAEILSTLVHEMVHGWQTKRGTAPKRAYHNKEWSAQMKAIGLYPSNSGAIGGRETGASMSHYIMPDGPFTRAYEALQAKGWKLNLQSAMRPNSTAARKSKTKFSCSECGQNVWGKPDTMVDCHHCKVLMRNADASYEQAAE